MFKYSILIIICLLLSMLIILSYGIKLADRKLLLYTFMISFGAMLVFDTYLTALPIVVYNMNSIVNIKIITFPIEDIGYLIAVILVLPGLFKHFCNEEKRHK